MNEIMAVSYTHLSAFGMLAAEDIAKFQAKYGYLGLQFLPYHVTGCDIPVSYTHLVGVQTGSSGIGSGGGDHHPAKHRKLRRAVYLPVSYTHLDVYKRQGHHAVRHAACAVPSVLAV